MNIDLLHALVFAGGFLVGFLVCSILLTGKDDNHNTPTPSAN